MAFLIQLLQLCKFSRCPECEASVLSVRTATIPEEGK